MQLADLEARGRLHAELVDITDTDAVVAACDDAALVWLESPTNPALEVADIPTITAAAHEAGAYVVVDNTFATPLLQRPLDARRRPRRALGDEVPRRAQRRADGRGGHPRRRAVRRAQGPARPARRDPRDRSRPGSRCAACAPCTCGSSGPRPTPPELVRRLERAPGRSARSATPASAAIVVDRARRGRAGRRPAHPQDEAVGARHLARRRRVDVRAAPPLEDRAGHHPRRRWCGCRVGIEDVDDLWADLETALDDLADPGSSRTLDTVANVRRRVDRLALPRVSRSRPWCRGR